MSGSWRRCRWGVLFLSLVAMLGCKELAQLGKGQASRAQKPPTSDTAGGTKDAAGGARATKNRPLPRDAASPSSATSATLGALQRELKRLAAREQAFFGRNSSYSYDLDKLEYTPPAGMNVLVTWASAVGWTGRVTSTENPGHTCTIHVGRGPRADSGARAATRGSGQPVCGTTSATAVVAAQDTLPMEVAPPTVSRSSLMETDLRRLVAGQAQYFANVGRYSSRLSTIGLRFLPHRGVSVQMLSADAFGWSAKATHVDAPGKSCVVWIGQPTRKPSTDGQGLAAAFEGVPVCDSL